MTNLETARIVLDALVAQGAGLAVHAPGARNLPMLAALQDPSTLETIGCVDERAAAFLALGWMRGRALEGAQAPALVVCTSGSAALNLLPATAEALESGLPLVLLTADRPGGEIGRGANQTVDQVSPFAPLVLEQLVLPCPREGEDEDLWSRVEQAIARCRRIGGPLHINLPFAEPLLPAAFLPRGERPPSSSLAQPAPSPPPLSEEEREAWRGLERGARRGLVWLCDAPYAQDRSAARQISRILDWPLLADGGSGLCAQTEGHPPLVVEGEELLPLLQQCEAVLQLGKRPISRAVAAALRGRPGLVVDTHPGVQDGAGAAWPRWRRSPRDILAFLEGSHLDLPAGDPEWREAWRAGRLRVGHLQARALAEPDTLSEVRVARSLMASLPGDWGFFVGNSLPVRLVDQWRPPLEHDLRVAMNRGLSGIDGLVATALGFQKGVQRPTALLIGDLSLRHDLGSLALVVESRAPLLVVAVHNGGGGIFRLQGDAAPHAWARHEHDLDLASAAGGLGMESCRVASGEELRQQLQTFVEHPRPLLLECIVEGEDHPRRQAWLRTRLLEEDPRPSPGPQRLWIHGFLGAPEDWQATREALGVEASQDRVLRLPGHADARDTLPRDPREWTDWVLDQLPAQGRVELVGYSMGGRLALMAALKAPHRVERLVLAGANPGLESTARRMARQARDEEWARLLEKQGLEHFLEAWYAQALFLPLMERPELRSFLKRRALGDARSLASVLRAMSPARQENLWPRLHELAMPVRWMAGERDTAYASVVRRAAARTVDGDWVLVPGAGHALPLEAPRSLAEGVRTTSTDQAKDETTHG